MLSFVPVVVTEFLHWSLDFLCPFVERVSNFLSSCFDHVRSGEPNKQFRRYIIEEIRACWSDLELCVTCTFAQLPSPYYPSRGVPSCRGIHCACTSQTLPVILRGDCNIVLTTLHEISTVSRRRGIRVIQRANFVFECHRVPISIVYVQRK
jgi:hypothetical protein